ncbi:hypothetical protein D3C87_1986910 [compost metagenome]
MNIEPAFVVLAILNKSDIKRPVGVADVFKVLSITGVAAIKDFVVLTLNHPRSPKCFVFIK